MGVDLGAALQAFVAVFPAELPDKSMFASMALVTRFGKPRAVWIGAACAFGLHAVIAAAVGGLLSRLPSRLVAVAAGVLFLVGAFVMLREARNGSHAEQTAQSSVSRTGDLAVVGASFMLLGIAEIGDLTQFMIAGLAARTGEPLSVGLGGWIALCSVAAIAVTAGRWLTTRFELAKLQRLGAGVFAALAIWSFVEAAR